MQLKESDRREIAIGLLREDEGRRGMGRGKGREGMGLPVSAKVTSFCACSKQG